MQEALNDCWRNEILLSDMNNARLAIIYKKGRTDLPQNYRPIALLNAIYKLLASAIQARISSKMDGTPDENQFGFRKGKSTAQPLFIFRRTQETQEEAASECHIIIRLRKGFRRSAARIMTKTIKRPGVPDKMINVINAIYKKNKPHNSAQRHGDRPEDTKSRNHTRMPTITRSIFHAHDRNHVRC